MNASTDDRVTEQVPGEPPQHRCRRRARRFAIAVALTAAGVLALSGEAAADELTEEPLDPVGGISTIDDLASQATAEVEKAVEDAERETGGVVETVTEAADRLAEDAGDLVEQTLEPGLSGKSPDGDSAVEAGPAPSAPRPRGHESGFTDPSSPAGVASVEYSYVALTDAASVAATHQPVTPLPLGITWPPTPIVTLAGCVLVLLAVLAGGIRDPRPPGVSRTRAPPFLHPPAGIASSVHRPG